MYLLLVCITDTSGKDKVGSQIVTGHAAHTASVAGKWHARSFSKPSPRNKLGLETGKRHKARRGPENAIHVWGKLGFLLLRQEAFLPRTAACWAQRHRTQRLRETSRTRKKASQAEQAGTGAGAGTGISAPLRTGKAGHDDVAGAPLSYSRSCCYCQRLCLPCGQDDRQPIASPESRQTTDRTSHLDR